MEGFSDVGSIPTRSILKCRVTGAFFLCLKIIHVQDYTVTGIE